MIWEEALWMWMQIRRLLWKQSRDYEWRKINLAWTEGKQASLTVLRRILTLALFKHWLHLNQESDFRVRIGKIFDLGGFWVQQLICCVTSGVKANSETQKEGRSLQIWFSPSGVWRKGKGTLWPRVEAPFLTVRLQKTNRATR